MRPVKPPRIPSFGFASRGRSGFGLPGFEDLAAFARLFEFRTVSRWVGFGMMVGVLSGLTAAAFFASADFVTHLVLGHLGNLKLLEPHGEQSLFDFEASGPPRHWVLVLAPAVGGLISGLLVYFFRMEGEPQGTDGMIHGFHHSQMRIRTSVVRAIGSVFVLGTGGSVGREGPVVMMGGGMGKLIGRTFKLSDREVRLLLLAGAAGGIGAIFRSPLGAALFVLEVLYRDDFEVDAVVPTVLSSVVGYSVFTMLFGQSGSIFVTAGHYDFYPMQLPLYLAMALGAALVGVIFSTVFHRGEVLFAKIPVPIWARPMIGGLMLGVLALFVPPAMGSGYGWLQQLLLEKSEHLPHGWTGAGVLIGLALVKVFATTFSHSSDGSGGVFGPSVVIGGMVGGAFGFAFHILFPDLVPQPGAFVLVGMACFVGGVANAPISTLVIASEMTGSHDLLVPVMFAEVVTFAFARKTPLYVEQVLSRRQSPAHAGETMLDLLQDMTVEDIYERGATVMPVAPDTPVSLLLKHASEATGVVFPVAEEDGTFTGLVSLDTLSALFADEDLQRFAIAADCATAFVSVRPEETLAVALERFTGSRYPQLPVVSSADSHEIVGVVRFEDLLRATRREALQREVRRRAHSERSSPEASAAPPSDPLAVKRPPSVGPHTGSHS